MAIYSGVSKSEYFSDMLFDDKDFVNRWFSRIEKKTLHSVDTLYFSVYLQEDTSFVDLLPDTILNLCDWFREKKASLRNEKVDLVSISDFDNLFFSKFGLAGGYGYRLTCPECFDVGFIDNLPNENTPRIQVQIRSSALWNNGVFESVNNVFAVLTDFLSFFDVKIKKVMETRIDYAYHTNIMSLSSMLFFSGNVIKGLNTTLSVSHFYGQGYNVTDNFVFGCTGVSFGSRKSRNIEVCIYDKVREVVTSKRKGYFLIQWYNAGLISKYDKYCYEYAYKAVSIDAIHKAKLQFYVDYGNDKARVVLYKNMLSKDLPLEKYRKEAEYMPPLTPVVNIEYRTHRKFYSNLDNFIDMLSYSHDKCFDSLLVRLYKILENRNLWLDSLTSDVFSFSKNGDFVGWWKRLRGTKIQTLGNNSEMLRKYGSNLDVQTILRRITRSVGVKAVYGKRLLTSFLDDFKEVIKHMGRGYGYKLIFSLLKDKSKVSLNDFASEFLLDYKAFKKNKYALIKNRLADSSLGTG